MVNVLHKIILISVLWINFTYAKDLALNFEKSCYQSYGDDIRETIIDSAISQINALPGNPRLFVRGEDIEEEIDESNYHLYLWNPHSTPSNMLFGHVDHREINPVVCDNTGLIQSTQNWVQYGWPIAGWANKPKENLYDFFAVFINENITYDHVCAHDFDNYDLEELYVEEHPTQQKAIALLMHELLHIAGVKHVEKKEPKDDYPIMWHANLNSTGVFQIEDYAQYLEDVPWRYNGKHEEFSFESKVDLNEGGRVKITVRVNVPNKFRYSYGELLVAAQIQGHDTWYMLTEEDWAVFLDTKELIGSERVLQLANDWVIYDDEWIKQSVKIYFGVRFDDEIYYNYDSPLLLKGDL